MGIVDDRMTYRRKAFLSLMPADFVTLGQDFDSVLVMLGLDEHKYVRFTREVAARFGADTSLRGDFTLASIYSQLTTGFDGTRRCPRASLARRSTWLPHRRRSLPA